MSIGKSRCFARRCIGLAGPSSVLRVLICMAPLFHATAATTAEREASLPQVTFDSEHGVVSVHAREVPFVRLMDAVAAESAAEVVIGEDDYGDITAELDAVPLEEALKLLLEGKNYLIVRPQAGRSQLQLWVLGLSQYGDTSVTVANPAAGEQPAQNIDVDKLLGSEDGLAGADVSRRLAQQFAAMSQIRDAAERFEKLRQNRVGPSLVDALSMDPASDEAKRLMGLVGSAKH